MDGKENPDLAAVTDVLPHPSEWQCDNVADFDRLLLRATVPGAGKSHAVLSRYAENCLVVCPTNALCVEFSRKYSECTTMTIHSFLRIRYGALEGSQDGTWEPEEGGVAIQVESEAAERGEQEEPTPRKNPEQGKVLLLDEIFMYNRALLQKLYFRLENTSALKVFATGDPNQLPPVGESSRVPGIHRDLKARREHAINILFPKQMTFKKCKRGQSAQHNDKMVEFCLKLQAIPDQDVGACVQLVKDTFPSISYDEAVGRHEREQDPPGHLSVCYFNQTCHDIARRVLSMGKTGKGVLADGKARTGVRLVNRKRLEQKRGYPPLMVNYEYTVTGVWRQARKVKLLCEEEGRTHTVPLEHVESHMHWAYTRTCHSLQGSGVEGSILLHDLDSRFMSKEFIYTAITRATKFDQIYYVTDGPRYSQRKRKQVDDTQQKKRKLESMEETLEYAVGEEDELRTRTRRRRRRRRRRRIRI